MFLLGGSCLIEFDWCVWLQQYVCLVDDSGVFVGWVGSMCVRVWVSGGGGPEGYVFCCNNFIVDFLLQYVCSLSSV